MRHWWCLTITPDAEAFVADANEAVRESYRQVDAGDANAIEMGSQLQLVNDLLDDPTVRQAHL